MSDLETNLKDVNSRIKMSAEKANRDFKDITLVAVTKEFDTSAIKEAIRLKITDIGETKVQEVIKKQKELGNLSKKVKWHLIGYLQSNKAKDAVKIFDMIHTIDRMKIAKKISNYCIQLKKEIPVLVQVNLSGLTHGIEPENIVDFVNDIRKLDELQVRGLMTIAPYVTDNEKTRPYFSQLRQLTEACHLTDLSMGMTNDFEVAIQEGATMVRIGTALFGQRVQMSKRTPLFETHRKLGAHFIEFAGWEMPVQYTSIIEEHNALRPFKQKLGHKSINSTMIYTHLVEFEAEEYTSRIASTREEKLALIEAGFEFVSCDPDGTQYFRKRK